MREDRRRGIFVEGLSEWVVDSPYDIYEFMRRGESCRATAATKLNDVSSRSHAIFSIVIEQSVVTHNELRVKIGRLNLVDLAGSERLSITGATGKRLMECKRINQSLSVLGNVIAALVERRGYVPYRDSKLTRLLKDSLGGNCRTVMMVMISPSCAALQETLSSLKFGSRAKSVRNALLVNENVEQSWKAEGSGEELMQELKHGSVSEKAFEQLSRELHYEREERKKKLETKLLYDYQKVGSELAQREMEECYERKLQELETERSLIEREKAEIKNYKQLLLKQRDTMVALTNKLQQRDEEIIKLSIELRECKKLKGEISIFAENKVDRNIDRVKLLEEFIASHGLPIPSTMDECQFDCESKKLIANEETKEPADNTEIEDSQRAIQEQEIKGLKMPLNDGTQMALNSTSNFQLKDSKATASVNSKRRYKYRGENIEVVQPKVNEYIKDVCDLHSIPYDMIEYVFNKE
eukprot:TRINITY_DN12906_c0_g1_i1.p1 TRINITY_DN12906_c0_g1~~TRINITY_DN12906_c0_g1_i1.p1  ORF type:complete len:468 (-),score=86.53 TRINITY_DN12906_c0_g1_i1:100-1503(-)